MGDFAEFGVPATTPPPVICTDTVTYGFLIYTGKIKLLKDLCANAFDKVSGGIVHCCPVSDLLLLQFSQTDWVGSKKSATGVGETEVLIHITVKWTVGGKTYGGFFTPYIWVNNSLALIGGREVFGYPKTFGRFEIQARPKHDPDAFILNTLSGGMKKYLALKRLLVVSKGASINSSDNAFTAIINRYQGDFRQAGSRDVPPMSDDFVQIVGHWLTAGIKNELFLKQFRDSTDQTGRRACFQQIACATYTITGGRRKAAPVFTPKDYGYRLTLANYPTAPITRDLGLVSGALPGGIVHGKMKRLELSPTTVHWQGAVPAIP